MQPPSLSLSPSCSLVFHSPTLSCHPPALPPQTAAFFSTDLILTGLVSCCWNHSIASSPLQQGPWGELCPPEKSLNNNPVSSEESWYQMEARSRDWLKVKSKLIGSEKICVGDGREALTWTCQHPCLLVMVLHWRRKWQPTPVFLPGESQGRGSLVGCRLRGRTESDTTDVT